MTDLGAGVKLVPRGQWTSRSPRSRTNLHATFGCTTHYGGPRMGWPWPHSSCPSKVRAWQQYHMDSRRWADLAYSFVVCPHGVVFEGRGLNTRTAANGTNDGNNRAYAVCYLAGAGDEFTEAAAKAFARIVAYCRSHGRAGPGRNCHWDWKATACPSEPVCAGSKAPIATDPPGGRVTVTAQMPVLRQGDSSPHVVKMKDLLINLTGAVIDGSPLQRGVPEFGPKTKRAVENLQRYFTVKDDGVVGPVTWRILLEMPL